MSEHLDNADEQATTIGPGVMLRQAREQMQLSQQQVADKLNLRASLIEEIEGEQFSAKTPKTFIRGYLRNYAKLVHVNEQALLDAFDQQVSELASNAQMKSFSQGTQKQAEHKRFMLVIYVLIIALIASTIIWWSQQSTQLSNKPLTSATASSSIDNNQESLDGDGDSVDAISSDNTSTDSSVASMSSPDDVEQDEFETQDDVFEQHMQNTTQAATPTAPVTATGVEQTTVDGNDATQAMFEFRFRGDCWVNIFDANGQRLAWGIKKAGYIMTLEGQAPFHITLGKPELVQLTYNQQAVDLSTYQAGQIAKFSWPLATADEP